MRRCTRRTILRAVLGAIIATSPLVRAAAAHAAPAGPVTRVVAGGSGTAKTWRWVALPDSGGLQVYVTDAAGAASVKVTWTADGAVTAAGLTATAGYLTSGAGYGLNVRRVP